jgi:hypothetical protein
LVMAKTGWRLTTQFGSHHLLQQPSPVNKAHALQGQLLTADTTTPVLRLHPEPLHPEPQEPQPQNIAWTAASASSHYPQAQAHHNCCRHNLDPWTLTPAS